MKVIDKKKLRKIFITKSTTAFKLVQNEIAILKKVCHPNVVNLYEIIDDENYDKLFIIMEYINGGTLLEYIKHKNGISEEKCWKFFREIISALEYCHEAAGVIHRDIKPENILIDEKENVHIVDFGISFLMGYGSDESKATLGSKYYMAPETATGKAYKGRLLDIWATGVTLFHAVTGKRPFNGKNEAEVIKDVVNKK